ncbi:molybdopterin converting factor subunit 1 [Methylocystis heyeri]|uniref:Molybdopterin converting factor subunit 1 n=1 Tax=Methylocystis heyeri TaxID=391905 RepID=A0A6B8KBT2_9HYPH|nr:molybdopterin converting factor subunit 1 [Methylocystis heyeri]QGM44501.1 molybdopterin converting factor subunit 1 [Methylocystis heyeri]
MRAVYFASVRERIGVTEEDIDPPAEVATVAQLIDWLAGRGEGYAAAFANSKTIRAAIDKAHARPDSPISAAREVAFFPPMTGG